MQASPIDRQIQNARRTLLKLQLSWKWLRSSLIWEMLGRQKRWVRALIALAVVNTVVSIAVAATLRKVVDEALDERTAKLNFFIGRLVFLFLVGMIAGFAQRQVTSRIGYQLEYELRALLYRRLQAADPRRLDSLASGQVVTRAQTDLLLLELLIVIIPGLGVGLTLLLGIAVLLFVLNPLLAPIALLAIPVNLYLVMRIRKRLWGLSWLALSRRAAVTGAIDEAVRGIRVVKTFGTEAHERARVRDAAESAFGVGMTRVRLLARYNLLLQAVPIVISAAMIALGAWIAVRGSLSIGSLLVFLLFSFVFVNFTRSFDEITSGWQYAKSGAGRIFELLNLPPAQRETATSPVPDEPSGLVIDGVSVAFNGHRVLDGIELRLEPGDLIAVTGPPRSGKSTLATLVTGAVVPASGTVTLDGVAVTDLEPEALSAGVRVLVEEPFLFGRSVRENLEMGATDGPGAGPAGSPRRHVDDHALWAALRAAAVDHVVREMPGGLDAVLGDRGLTLSGGQRQRLALARAIVSAPRVLVLDDALSAVNPSLEAEVIALVRAYAPRMAVLWITRRDPDGIASEILRLEAPAAAVAVRPSGGYRLGDDPYAPDLKDIIASLPPDTEHAPVTEGDSTESDRVPTVPSVLRPLRRRVLQATGVLLVLTVVGLVPEGLTKIAIDGIEARNAAPAFWVAAGTAAIALVTSVSVYFFQLFAKRIDEGIMYLLRRRTFQRLSRLGIDFYDRELPGKVAARVVHDLDRISAFVDTGVYVLAVSFALLIGASIVIAVWSPPVAATVAMFIPILLIVTGVQVPVADRAYRRARDELGKVIARLQEDYSGRYVIDGFGIRDRARRGFMQTAWGLRQARRWSTSVTNAYVEIVQGMTGLATAALIWKAGTLSFAGVLSIGSVLALMLYLRNALAPIPMLGGVLQRYLAAKASFRTLAEPYEARIRPPERTDVRRCPELHGEVSLEGVRFAYPGTDAVVLDDLSLQAPAKKALALVGPTGAGKSSVAKLLAQIYEPDAGSVRVDGIDLRELEVGSYRRRVGVVPQESFLFRRTVAENIAYGRPDAAREQIESTVAEIGASEIIAAIPGGLDGQVEEEGRNLTAAQRQVIAIARAWIVDPDILVLDEATSNLDTDTERVVLDAVLAAERTTILITHRLQVAQRADVVAVIDDGRIVECGTPSELAERDGAYARLWATRPNVDAFTPIAARDGVTSEVTSPRD